MLVPVVRHEGAGAGGLGTGEAARAPASRLREAVGLARAIDLVVCRGLAAAVPRIQPGTLFGAGKVAEIADLVREESAALVIVDRTLSPVQQRNLEKAWNVKVLDRTGLILEIFGRRARTREGRLQVELAHLSYQKSRLVRSWTHLERQRGGRGFLGGPGEAQIELDRRMIGERIAAIRKELGAVVRTRALHRAGRRRVPYPVVALAGYTNAGKSTLFNRLTGADVLVKDQVFATLDPTMREVRLPTGRRIILSDTVGFISDLPAELVAAFRATLEEVVAADLVLHVRDISDAETEAQARDVENVLAKLGIASLAEGGPVIEVWNKIDLLTPAGRTDALRSARWRQPAPVPVSAASGEGIGALLAVIGSRLACETEDVTVVVGAHQGRVLHWLYENARVIEQSPQDDGAVACRVRIEPGKRGRLASLMQTGGTGPAPAG